PIDERAEQAEGVNDRKKVVAVEATRPAVALPTLDNPPRVPQPDSKKGAPTVPSVIGLDYRKAKQILEQLGYEVALFNGSVADRDEEINRIERQTPDAKTSHPQGEKVKLWVFLKPKATTAEKE
ncbi:MAG TPA: PASTA domain-containing protein, partial [Planctomycetaceae bacterium]|nr:PASTA domain-containing protein [Planctomycetaceae bacterium]